SPSFPLFYDSTSSSKNPAITTNSSSLSRPLTSPARGNTSKRSIVAGSIHSRDQLKPGRFVCSPSSPSPPQTSPTRRRCHYSGPPPT
uniref:Uncharacterized protein n=1 Tax=Triticum urartu TaxID=4572 RepID=A0A8R7R3W0_TRIUA